MAFLCFVTNGAGGYTANEVATQDLCTGFVAQASADYVSLSSLGTLFQTYFAFDEIIFAEITGGLLLVFVAGHTLGRMMQAWRKAM